MYSVDDIKQETLNVRKREIGGIVAMRSIAFVFTKILERVDDGLMLLSMPTAELHNRGFIISTVVEFYRKQGFGVMVFETDKPTEFIQIHWDRNYLQ